MGGKQKKQTVMVGLPPINMVIYGDLW